MVELTDETLVKSVQNGDQTAFRELVERYQRRLFSVAYGMVRNREDALDVVQEAFIKIHRHLDNFQGSSSFYTWAYRITVNTYLDNRRKLRLKEVLLSTFDMLRFKGPEGSNPETIALNRMTERQVKRSLKILSPAERVVFTLNALEGLSYKDIQEITGQTSRAIKTAMYRARKTLARELPLPGNEDGTQ